MSPLRRVPLALAALLAGSGGLLVAQARPSALRQPTLAEDLQMFSQILNQIRVNHPDSIDVHRLVMAAIEGMVQAADPHSYVLPITRLSPEKAQALEDGKLYPLPISFRFVGGAPVVSSVSTGSQASRADILRGDELIAVDGQPVLAESSAELEVGLAGAKGSQVRLTLRRQRSDGSELQVERTVRRERVAEEGSAVPVASMLDDQTGYVRIVTFESPKVADDLHDAVGRLKGRGMKRMVLDLRDNGGGLVAPAAEVAGEFLPSGAIVYVSETRKEKPDTVKVKRSFWKKEERFPLIVLVDDGTASASELVAGALQDHDRALIVGRPSFGKALLMRGFPLLDGSAIVMVIGRVRTPCGRIVQREYRSISRRDYYRLAGSERDTAGRPSCLTTSGRRVYGGGGIYPDVLLPEPVGAPVWLARLFEDDVPLKWAGGYLTESGAPVALDSLVARPAVDARAVASFRAFALARGTEIPAGDEIDERLARLLALELAESKWGDAGYYRVRAARDPAVVEALKYFDRAAALAK